MDINEEKIIEEIKKVFAAKVSSSDEPCCKCGGKSPMEMRWNVEEKENLLKHNSAVDSAGGYPPVF